MQVDFYHLTRMPLERALPQIYEAISSFGAFTIVGFESAANLAEEAKALGDALQAVVS